MSRVLFRFKHHLPSISYRHAAATTTTTQRSKTDVFLIPEVPPDTPESFRHNLQTATSRLKHLSIDPKYVDSMPQEGLTMAKSGADANKVKPGPWIVKLTSPTYEYFMEYCPERERALRWNTWQGHSRMSSYSGGDKLISHITTEKTRATRGNRAGLFGCESLTALLSNSKLSGTQLAQTRGMASLAQMHYTGPHVKKVSFLGVASRKSSLGLGPAQSFRPLENCSFLNPAGTNMLGGVRPLTYYSFQKGKRRTVKTVLKRFYRLDWGAWIRPKAGRHRKVWRKNGKMKYRALQHVFCNSTQSHMLDKMVSRFWREKKYYVDDPYESYHVRDNFYITRKWHQ